MRSYKYRKEAGALNEAALPPQQQQQQQMAPPASYSNLGPPPMPPQAPSDDYVSVHDTGVHDFSTLQRVLGEAGAHAQAQRAAPPRFQRGASGGANSSLEANHHTGRVSMFFYTVEEGQRVLVIHRGGRMEIVEGPAKVARRGRRFRRMEHHVAHPGEFLIVRFRDGTQEHIVGPAHLWLDPRQHMAISKEECIQIAEREAIVVYSKQEGEAHGVSRRIVYGPKDFVPQPGEWLHTFSWHGSAGGAEGYRKIPNALVFQKLWMLPDQMYHDIPDVRTADGVVLTIRLMLFFELVDIETMLVTTHDPIGDFVNAATSDVVEFVGKLRFEAFKDSTEKLNDLGTYRQLVSRGESCGYAIRKVVYRGYGAPPALQRMHEQAMEARTKLQFEKATEEQAQKLADFQLERRLAREAQEADAAAQRQAREMESAEARKAFERRQAQLDEAQARAAMEARDAHSAAHLERLAGLGVDLTRYLTQGQADRVIELRGGAGATHVHVDAQRRSREGG